MVEKKLPQYESPVVMTYTDEEILEELGPANTIGSSVRPLPPIPSP